MTVCAKCQHTLSGNETFCNSCGERVSGALPTVSGPATKNTAYYVPWTIFVPVCCLAVGVVTRGYYLVDLSRQMAFIYVYGALAPVLAYQLIPESKRSTAHIVHAVWFIAVVCMGLLRYRTYLAGGTTITPHDIHTVRFGLRWSSMVGGNNASTWLLACALIGIAYFCEKRLKENWRKTGQWQMWAEPSF